MVCVSARVMLQRRPGQLAFRPGPLKPLLSPPATSWTSTGTSSTFGSTLMVASRLIGFKRPSLRDPAGPARLPPRRLRALWRQQVIQARSLHHDPCDEALVDMDGGYASASDAHPLILQRVGSVVPAAAYAGATIDCRIFYLARAWCRKRGLTTPQGF